MQQRLLKLWQDLIAHHTLFAPREKSVTLQVGSMKTVTTRAAVEGAGRLIGKPQLMDPGE